MVRLDVHALPLLAAICGLAAVLAQAIREPRQLLRPSIAIAVMQLMFVVPGAVLAAEMRGGDSIDDGLRLGVCCTPLLIALAAVCTPKLGARCVLLVHYCSGARAGPREQGLAMVLALAAAAMVVLVLALLPWSKIGLVALLSSPGESLEAREASLRALEVPGLKTLIGVFNRLAMPLCLGMLACMPLHGVHGVLLATLAAGPILLPALGGARLQAVIGSLTLCLGFVIRRWSTLGVLAFVAAMAAAGVAIAAATAARIGDGDSILDVSGRVFYRATVQPFVAGMTHVAYVDAMGRWGPEAFGFPLKQTLGFEHVEPSEAVGEWFAPGTGTLVTPPAVLDLIASFGVTLGILGLVAYSLLLDGVAGMLLRLPPASAVAGLTVLLTRSLDLVNTTIGSGLTAALFVVGFALLLRIPTRERRPRGACATPAPIRTDPGRPHGLHRTCGARFLAGR